MRILVGCEESGTVRDAFIRKGHDAWSNDLLPCRNGNEKHLLMDVREAIKNKGPWDLIIIFPDCTKLCLSGNRWYGKGTIGYSDRISAIEWTVELWRLAKQHAIIGAALENPTGVIWEHINGPQQWIHPWEYGHEETKKTGLALYKLPPLLATDICRIREQKIWKMPPGPNRKRDRSKTFDGIAEAMADQWGCL